MENSSVRLDVFIRHLRQHLGQVVTIYTPGEGGVFTGILLQVNRNFIKVVTRIGSAPVLLRARTRANRRCTGSEAVILTDKIIAFVHNI